MASGTTIRSATGICKLCVNLKHSVPADAVHVAEDSAALAQCILLQKTAPALQGAQAHARPSQVYEEATGGDFNTRWRAGPSAAACSLPQAWASSATPTLLQAAAHTTHECGEGLVSSHEWESAAGQEPEAQVLQALAPGGCLQTALAVCQILIVDERETGCAPQIRRLAKAARHAAELSRLAEHAGIAHTAVEAEAYASYIAGIWLSEKGTDWPAALGKLQRSQCALPLLPSQTMQWLPG